MKHNQWQEVMCDAITAGHVAGETSLMAAGRLRASVTATIDPERMKDDTIFRTRGACGANNTKLISGIAESFHRLNGGRDGG